MILSRLATQTLKLCKFVNMHRPQSVEKLRTTEQKITKSCQLNPTVPTKCSWN